MTNRKRNDYDYDTTITAMSYSTSTGRGSCYSRRSTGTNVNITPVEPTIKKRKTGLSDLTINSKLCIRLSDHVLYWPVTTNTVTQSRCQLHTCATNSKSGKCQ